MPPIRDPLTTTSDQIEKAIFYDVMKPITSALFKEDPRVLWTSYGSVVFGLVWMGYKFRPRIFYYCISK
jgi:hypothetical protein